MNKIDFNEIKKNAQILKRIVYKREQEADKIKHPSFLTVLISVLIAIVVGALMNPFLAVALPIIVFYSFRWRKNYRVNTMYEDFEKQFPEWTPQDVLKYKMDSVKEIEVALYKDKVLILKSDAGLGDFHYKNLGYIESDISMEELIEQAYALEADVIAHLTFNKTVSNKVTTRAFNPKHIDTTTDEYHHFSGDAIKIIDKKSDVNSESTMISSNENNIHDEIMKLVDLHKSNILTDDEFAKAKQKLLKT